MTTSVLHVYRTYYPDPPGGLQEAIRQIALATGAYSSISNKIFTLSKNPVPHQLTRPEGEVIRQRSWLAPASCDLGGIRAVGEFTQLANKADVINLHFPWPFADILYLASNTKTPAVLTYHSDVVRQKLLGYVYNPVMWKMLKAMKFIVATSPAYAISSPVLSHSSIKSKVRVIPLGIDESSYPSSGDDTVFPRLGLSSTEPYFLFIGVLRYYKGVHTLVRAARKVGARIVIAGSGPESDGLKRLAEDTQANNIVFAGQISNQEKVSLLKNCLGLVLPSHLRSEAFGMVLVEAAMMGRPMISCEITTGTSYVNQHEETGLVIKPEDPEELARVMNEILLNPALAGRLGAGARLRYEKYFSGQALGKAYSSLYQEL